MFTWLTCFVFVLLPIAISAAMQGGPAPTDPGVRGGAAGAGGEIAGLSVKEAKFFDAGLDVFVAVNSVQGTIANTEAGLGPRFNLDSCGGCHAQPATGGTSPFVNPQVGVATRNGAANTVPSFITLNGPVREARFRFVDPPANTIRDGGVHDLFTITGRMDATGCNIGQPDFARFPGNVVFRIPTPVFGAGLIEAIKDSTILDNKNANLDLKRPLGITGHENREGNAGTISRLGWKAQNKSLAIFSGEAYNVEQGVSNEVFQQERDETPGCLFNATPESQTNFEETPPLRLSSDVVNFTNFMRFLAPPSPVSSFPGAPEASIRAGRASFDSVGCALCHTPSLTTGVSTVSALSNKTANLFSDLLVHHMGTGLADDVIQGNAGPDEFRTAPLWGLGKRIFFLHDGRTNNLLNAIQAHSSTGSEANGSIDAFNRLTAGEKQNILNFLRSL